MENSPKDVGLTSVHLEKSAEFQSLTIQHNELFPSPVKKSVNVLENGPQGELAWTGYVSLHNRGLTRATDAQSSKGRGLRRGDDEHRRLLNRPIDGARRPLGFSSRSAMNLPCLPNPSTLADL